MNNKAAVTYTSEFDEPLEHDMYMILRTKYGDIIAKIANKGSTSINITLNLSSMDTGIMNLSLLSHGSDDNTLFTSNVQSLLVRPTSRLKAIRQHLASMSKWRTDSFTMLCSGKETLRSPLTMNL